MRYLVAATLARGADAGAAIGVVLLAATTPHLSRPSLVGALLVSCLTAPHLLGPLLGHRLDRARDGRRLIAAVTVGYGVAVAAAALGLGVLPIALVAVLAVAAGAGGPLLTGGLSSRLGVLVAADEQAQRRAQGWDALSYGVAGTAGPALVATLAGVLGARAAVLAVAGVAVLAAGLMLTLPADRGPAGPGQVMTVRQALRLIATTGPLRRVMYTTMVVAAATGSVVVLAVALGAELGVGADSAAFLAAAFGLGNLMGSLVVTARPLLGQPERLVAASATLFGLGFFGCALAPNYRLAVVTFAVVGFLNAPLFTATLAARSNFSPPQARAQVFVSMAALKTGAASAGTAAAGAALSLGPRVLLALAASVVVAVAGATLLDRRFSSNADGTAGPGAGTSRSADHQVGPSTAEVSSPAIS